MMKLFRVAMILVGFVALALPSFAQERSPNAMQVLIAETVPDFYKAPWKPVGQQEASFGQTLGNPAESWALQLQFKVVDTGYQNTENGLYVVVSSYWAADIGQYEEFMLWYGDATARRYALKIGPQWKLAADMWSQGSLAAMPVIQGLTLDQVKGELTCRLVMEADGGPVIRELVLHRKP